MKVALAIAALATMSAAAQAADNGALSRGKVVFTHWCAPCHGSGPGNPGTVALAVKYGSSKPAELERRTDLTPEIVKVFVRQGFSVMAPFRKTEINDEELEDLAKFLSRPSKKATKQ